MDDVEFVDVPRRAGKPLEEGEVGDEVDEAEVDEAKVDVEDEAEVDVEAEDDESDVDAEDMVVEAGIPNDTKSCYSIIFFFSFIDFLCSYSSSALNELPAHSSPLSPVPQSPIPQPIVKKMKDAKRVKIKGAQKATRRSSRLTKKS